MNRFLCVRVCALQDGTRIAAIAENIHKTLDELLQKLTPENIKCVCQTLKVRCLQVHSFEFALTVALFCAQLCGYELEMDCPTEVTGIINVLRQQKDVDVSTERLINSVLDLQGNRWGRNEAACELNICRCCVSVYYYLYRTF